MSVNWRGRHNCHNRPSSRYLKALQWLRGPKCDVRPELAAILSSSKTQEEVVDGSGTKRKFPLSDFSRPECYRPLLILVGTFFLMQASGHFAVIFYAVNIFKDMGVTSNPYVPAIIVGVIRLTGKNNYVVKSSEPKS